MNARIQPTCYACDKPATTREHAPPRSFFPEAYRNNNLITVPSCASHNNDNSKDVEYARNIISTYYGVNNVGQELFLDKSMRSFDRSPALLNTAFSDIRLVMIRGATCGAFTVDVERIEVVMRACVSALHFHFTGTKRLDWTIVLASLGHSNDVSKEQREPWLNRLSLFHQIPFAASSTSTPDIWEFAKGDLSGGIVYAMRFYRSFLVYAHTAE